MRVGARRAQSNMTFLYIVLACLAGSLASVLLAALVAWRLQPRLIPLFVSYAVGALLGVVFLDLLPHIFHDPARAHHAPGWILGGIVAFFILEKLVLWRHDHDHAGQAEAAVAGLAHTHAHSPTLPHTHAQGHGHHAPQASAWMIIIGDGFHNFTDGFAIAAAFMADPHLGVATALAIVAHELPQELGDFLVLIHSGFSRARALFWNVMSSLATLLGASIAWVAMKSFEQYGVVFLCLAAASMIYVAIADLIPGLHKRTTMRESVLQVALIAAGVFSIWLVHVLMG